MNPEQKKRTMRTIYILSHFISRIPPCHATSIDLSLNQEQAQGSLICVRLNKLWRLFKGHWVEFEQIVMYGVRVY